MGRIVNMTQQNLYYFYMFTTNCLQKKKYTKLKLETFTKWIGSNLVDNRVVLLDCGVTFQNANEFISKDGVKIQ